MDTDKRREKILNILEKATTPLAASALANTLSVSRQIIVGDIALLRASGHEIVATPKGYILESLTQDYNYVGTIASCHTMEGLKEELYTIVDYGGTAIDVTVEHNVYGQLSGILNISSRYDADLFISDIVSEKNKLLSNLTGGVHLHKIGCKDEKTFTIIKNKLHDLGLCPQ